MQNECTSRFGLIEGCQGRPSQARQSDAIHLLFAGLCAVVAAAAAAAGPVVTD